MKIKPDKQLRHIKVKDNIHTLLKHRATDCQQSLQDYVNMILENFLKERTDSKCITQNTKKK
jgi:hypothetical protein